MGNVVISNVLFKNKNKNFINDIKKKKKKTYLTDKFNKHSYNKTLNSVNNN